MSISLLLSYGCDNFRFVFAALQQRFDAKQQRISLDFGAPRYEYPPVSKAIAHI
jgi:hypothetical protein